MVMNFKNFTASVNDLKTPTLLEKGIDVNDGQGGINRTWVAQTGIIWVNDQVRRSTFVGEGQQLQVEDLHWVTMRYLKDVVSGDRWRFNGEFGIWYVKTIVDPKNDRHWLVAVCTEIPQ